MTTDIYVVNAENLSTDNEVFNFGEGFLAKEKAWAGVSWFVNDSPAYDALLSVLKLVYRSISNKFPGYSIWFFAGNSAWQSDTKIVRHYKLWKALTARGVKISHSCNTQEVIHEKKGKLKFFGATKISELSITSVARALLSEPCSYLVVLPKDITPEDFVKMGWSGDLSKDFDFIDGIVGCGGFLIKRSGEFDDRVKGMICIASPIVINSISAC